MTRPLIVSNGWGFRRKKSVGVVQRFRFDCSNGRFKTNPSIYIENHEGVKKIVRTVRIWGRWQNEERERRGWSVMSQLKVGHYSWPAFKPITCLGY